MADKPDSSKKPLFSIFSSAAALIAVVLMLMLDTHIRQGEDLRGYGPGSLASSFMIALLLSGMITGQIGLIRGEKPAAIPILALFVNGVIFITAIILFPR